MLTVSRRRAITIQRARLHCLFYNCPILLPTFPECMYEVCPFLIIRNLSLITTTFQSGPAMTSAGSFSTLGSTEQNPTTSYQKSCSRALWTCSNPSWLITSSFSVSFPLSHCQLQGRKGADLKRCREQPSRGTRRPACTAPVTSLPHTLL